MTMFKFGDYTLEEVTQVWDCSEESVQTLVDSWSGTGHIRRQYWLFGPILFEKYMIDTMAPDIRAMMKRLGSTRADRETREQQRNQTLQSIEQHEEAIAAIQKRSREQQEHFFQQMEAIQQAQLKHYLHIKEKDLPQDLRELIQKYPDVWQRMKEEREPRKNDPAV